MHYQKWIGILYYCETSTEIIVCRSGPCVCVFVYDRRCVSVFRFFSLLFLSLSLFCCYKIHIHTHRSHIVLYMKKCMGEQEKREGAKRANAKKERERAVEPQNERMRKTGKERQQQQKVGVWECVRELLCRMKQLWRSTTSTTTSHNTMWCVFFSSLSLPSSVALRVYCFFSSSFSLLFILYTFSAQASDHKYHHTTNILCSVLVSLFSLPRQYIPIEK